MTKTNVDVLLYDTTPLSISLQRVLSDKTDISFFTEKDMSVVIPDVIVFTKPNMYEALKDIHKAEKQFKDAKLLYITQTVDSSKLATIVLFGNCSIVTASTGKNLLYTVLRTLGLTPKGDLSKKYKTRFINTRYFTYESSGLTCPEICILCAKLHGYRTKELSKIFGISQKNIDILYNSAYKALTLLPHARRSALNIIKYGGIVVDKPSKRYTIPKSRRYGNAYFIIPKIDEN